MGREGIERWFLRRLPEIQLSVLVPALTLAAASADDLHKILALSVALGWTFLLIPFAVASLIVAVMKGPRRVADSLALPDRDAPG